MAHSSSAGAPGASFVSVDGQPAFANSFDLDGGWTNEQRYSRLLWGVYVP